jgi:hypothetical protein
VLTDNGSQYVTWRGKSAFAWELEKRGIKQEVAAPRRPQTLGKLERFWGTLWRECVEGAIFVDFGDAQRRIGLFIDYYNFQPPHQGIGGLVPADRFFGAAPEVLRALQERVTALRHECEQLRRQVARQQALLRVPERTVGLAAAAPSASAGRAGPKKRRRKPKARALQSAAVLQEQEAPAAVPSDMGASP